MYTAFSKMKNLIFILKNIAEIHRYKAQIRKKIDFNELESDLNQWSERIKDVISCPDNLKIIRVKDSGQINKARITMHNGVQVYANSYYGEPMAAMLVQNKGVHEPQEEYAFEEILKKIPDKCTMIELGAYWGFYSLSLLQKKSNAECYLIEPSKFNILCGKLNFKLNKKNGVFTQAFISDKSLNEKVPTISVEDFCSEKSITRINILHSDIQGFEEKMLIGCGDLLAQSRIDYIFISTHSNSLHTNCINILKNNNYKILCEADLDNTFSVDGLIVAASKAMDSVEIKISKKNLLYDNYQ